MDGILDATNARASFPWQNRHPGQDRFEPRESANFDLAGYTVQLEPLSYARLFALVMIHAQFIATIAKCNKKGMSGFYTHLSLEVFEQTAKLVQKIKNSKIDEKGRATLKENLSTIYALTELNIRLRDLYGREAFGRNSNFAQTYVKRQLAYEKRKLNSFDQLDSVQRHDHEESLSQWAEAERSSITHDQRLAHLKAYAAHWLEKLGEGPNESDSPELVKWDMEIMCPTFFSIIREP